jgi:hypothetical protein
VSGSFDNDSESWRMEVRFIQILSEFGISFESLFNKFEYDFETIP